MTDIPEDVMKLAREARAAYAARFMRAPEDLCDIVAAAILADRERNAEPVAWRWAWKTTGSPLEQRFADPDLYEWAYRNSAPKGDVVKKMDIEPLYTIPPDASATIARLEQEKAELLEGLKKLTRQRTMPIHNGDCETYMLLPPSAQMLEDARSLIAKHDKS